MLKTNNDVIYLDEYQSKMFKKIKARQIPTKEDWWAVELEGALIPMTSLELYAYITKFPILQHS